MHPDPSAGPVPLADLIRLVRDRADTVHVVPTKRLKAGMPPAFTTFPLPRVPLSLHCWLTGLSSEFFRRHQRCVAALLLLDCQQQRWLPPVLPSQACGAEGASWTLDVSAESPWPAHRRVGGSFQARRNTDVIDAAGCVPQFHGLHIVQSLNQDISPPFCFLREWRGISTLRPESAVIDDWDQALAEASDRMTFE